ncbi:hypothetical protein C8J57DRAFT_1437049 [Mycena rebaudengoi]|nr:hypothetical protein C8J57DRAFT_1437049 [Mycena rebaudengoi]
METCCGIRRGSYIWGRRVHNIRIEHLWVDITVQLGATWSEHSPQPNHSPADMFVFDMLAHGVHGNQLLAEEEYMDEEELEVYGIDWAGLRDDNLLTSQRENNPVAEEAASWIGRVGPPPLTELSSVVMEAPAGMLNNDQVLDLYNAVVHLLGSAEDDDCIALWTHALVHACRILPDLF